jgi:uncharacterized protein YfaS (alpha-2-macroglobulin family)
MDNQAKTSKPGIVEKIIESPLTREPDKAQISVEGADHLYREIRIENTLEDENGKETHLKAGDHVIVTVEADKQATNPRN